MLHEGPAAAYQRGLDTRESFLRRARDASRLTIPSLVPPLGHHSSQTLPTPYQGLGSQGVNNLASKLMLSLFPPTNPFFRLVPSDPEALDAAGDKVRTEIEEGLTRMERTIASALEVSAIRVKIFETLKHLIVAGNVTLHVDEKGKSRVLSLDQYVTRRDPMGWLEELVVKESLDRESLPRELHELLEGSPAPMGAGPAETNDPIPVERGHGRDQVDLYTRVVWEAETERYHLDQEVAGRRVPGVQSFPAELMPFRVLRYAAIDGEDYGRGMVEEVIGDLVSLDGLMRAIVEAAAITSRITYLVNPAGATTADDLNRAPNGAAIVGREGDVVPIQSNKSSDLQVSFAAVQRIEERLSRAFLLNTAVQRQAERVTAEEIRYVANELEATLGGVFSVLSQELQLPLVTLFMHMLQRQRKIKRLPKGTVRPAIVTGVEALGRGQELQRLNVATQTAQAIVGPENLNKYMLVRNLLGQIFTAAGLDTTGLLRSEEDVAEQERMAQIFQSFQRMAPEVAKQVGPGLTQQLGIAPVGQEGAPSPQPKS
jgi:hypothetical protein